MFAVLTKVGVYVVLRTWLLLFGGDAGGSGDLGGAWLTAGGMATLAFGAIGVLASQDLRRLASDSLLVSSGTLLAAIGVQSTEVTGAALYYLVVSTLGVSALFLLTELMERGRAPGADILAVTAEAFGEDAELDPNEEIGIAIPATMAVLGVSFACSALVIAGLPPLAGFVGKFALLDALLAVERVPASSWIIVALVIISGFAALIGLARAGVRRFWAAQDERVPRVRVVEIAPVIVLVGLCAVLTIEAGSALRYFGDAARALHAPGAYVDRVLAPAMKRLLPFPLLWLSLLAMWLVLNESIEPGQILLGALIAYGATHGLRALQVPRTGPRRLTAAVTLVAAVISDVVVSNIAVARLVLHPGARGSTSGFVRISLNMRSPAGLAALACIITATPGTAWAGYDPASGMLTMHVLDLTDEETWIRTIKGRYERRLMEIFG